MSSRNALAQVERLCHIISVCFGFFEAVDPHKLYAPASWFCPCQVVRDMESRVQHPFPPRTQTPSTRGISEIDCAVGRPPHMTSHCHVSRR